MVQWPRWLRQRRTATTALDGQLLGAARAAASAPDAATALQTIVDALASSLDAERVEARVTTGPGPPDVAVSPAGEAPSPSEALDHLSRLVSAPLHLTEAELATHEIEAALRGAGAPRFRGLAAAPLECPVGTVAGIVVATRKRHGDFDADDESIVATLTEMASLSLDVVRQSARAAIAHERLERVVRDSPLAVAIQNDSGIIFANAEAHRLLGLPPDALLLESPATPAWDLVHEDGSPLSVDELPSMRARVTGVPSVGIIGLRHRQTRERRFGLVGAHAVTPDGSEILSIGADITDQVRSRALQERQRRVLTAIAEGFDVDQVIDRICRAVDELIEGSTSALLGREHDELRVLGGPSLTETARDSLDGLPIGRDGGPCGLSVQWGQPVVVADITRDPAWIHARDHGAVNGWRACWGVPFRLPDDTVIGALSVHQPTAREPTAFEWEVLEAFTDLARIAIESDRAQRELRASREAAETASERFRTIIEAAPLAIFEIDAAGNVRLWNRAAEAMFGWRRDEVIGRPPPIIPTDDRSAYLDIQARVARGEIVRRVELTRRCKDGSHIDVALAAAPLLDEHGAVHGGLAMMADISDQRRLEEQLLRAQRMEAVGRLAGGIAHDFNNLLTAIQGHIEFLMEEATDESTLQDLEAVRLASQRGAKLTAQLLAVGRRQLVRPEIVDLGEIIATMRPLLERLLGEQTKLAVTVSPTIGGARIDPVQMEQVLLNLAVNARDAMPEGGRLEIVGSDVELDRSAAPPEVAPGRFVRLTVRDTGVGMEPETVRQAFEPFFTTKDPSHGTGLGLAAAYGIIAQAGGHLSVTSIPGGGSTFTILLPAVDLPASEAALPDDEPVATGGHETVLLVEDEEPVRSVGRKVLERHGYTVLEAADAEAALQRAGSYRSAIHLLVTDIVLPQMGGVELSRTLAAQRPDLRVLLVSGYADGLPADDVLDGNGLAFLAKPFGPNELARTVRELLDAP